MKVILLERVGRLGSLGDEVTVKNGYGRNFLLPQGKAIRANEVNRARFESERATIEKRNEDRRDAAAGIAEGLNGVSIVMIRQASEAGTLYGSVSSRDIADGLSEKDFNVTKNAVILPLPIKTVGIHEVALNLHADVDVIVNVNVARSESEAERQDAGEDMTVFDFDDEDKSVDAEKEVSGDDDADADASEEAETEETEETEEAAAKE